MPPDSTTVTACCSRRANRSLPPWPNESAWRRRVRVSAMQPRFPTTTARGLLISCATPAARVPTEAIRSLTISWDPARLNITGEEVAEELARTKPRIALGAGGGGRGSEAEPGTTSISVTAWMMQPGDDKVVAERIYGVLSAKRGPRSTAMPAPSANVSGRWDVEIEFFSSRSKHTLFIEQDGNWILAIILLGFASADRS